MKIQIDPVSDQAILTLLREGKHRRAARLVVRNYGSAVFHLCYSLVKEIEQAEDLTQASFQKALSSLSSLQGQRSTIDWLKSVALSCCESHLQEQGREPSQPLEGGADQEQRGISPSLQRRLDMLASCL